MKLRNWFLFLLSAIVLHSCTLITDPERIYNNNAHPPQTFTYNFNNIPSGKHINGTVILNFDPPEITSNVRMVNLFIDNELIISTLSGLPHQFYLYTNNYPEGSHKISFLVYLRDNSSGLLYIIGAPSKIYETTLVFDRTPPDNVTMSQPVMNSNGLELSWSESVNENFFAYIFFRSVNEGDFVPVDTIFNKNETTYLDTSIAELTGLRYQYRGNVTTDPQFSNQASSDTAVYRLGNTINYNFNSFQAGPFCSEKNSRVYFIADNKLISFSTVDESFLNETNISNLYGQEGDPIECTFNKDESRIYFYNVFRNILCIVNPVNQNIIKAFNPYEGQADMLIPDDSRIIFNNYLGLKLIDIETNTLLKFLPLNHPVLYPAALNEDHTRLITISTNGWYHIIDVTNNDLNIIDSVQFNKYFDQLKSAGSLLCGDGNWLYNSNTYELIGSLANSVNYFSVSSDRVITVTTENFIIPGFSEVSAYKISQYNAAAQHLGDKYYIRKYQYPQTVAFHNKVYASDRNTMEQNVLGYVLNFGD